MSMASSEESVDAVAYHTQLAGDWEQRYRKHSFRGRLTVVLEGLEQRGVEGSAWLDAGCGTGTLSRCLAERGCNVLGVDASSKMVEVATRLAQEKTCTGRLSFEQVETIAKLDLADNSLDGILCSSVLEYASDPNACLTEFARVLRSGGALLVSVPNRHSMIRRSQTAWYRLGGWFGQTWVQYLKYSCNQYSVEEFRAILITHGFFVEKIVPFGGPLPLRLGGRSFMQSLLMFNAKKT
jgi:2-polyprenyl-3-methyl-5-hydroxy-6-metoxy-1,4-benzoquinol methylase